MRLLDGQLTRLFAVDEAARWTADKAAAVGEAAAVDEVALQLRNEGRSYYCKV